MQKQFLLEISKNLLNFISFIAVITDNIFYHKNSIFRLQSRKWEVMGYWSSRDIYFVLLSRIAAGIILCQINDKIFHHSLYHSQTLSVHIFTFTWQESWKRNYTYRVHYRSRIIYFSATVASALNRGQYRHSSVSLWNSLALISSLSGRRIFIRIADT